MQTIAVAAGVGLLALGTAFAQVSGGSHAFGKTLAEWMVLDVTWRLGGDQLNPEGKMVFLPDINDVEEGEWVENEDTGLWDFSGELDVTLRPDQKFSMSLIYYYGEQYEDGTEDAPEDFDIEGALAAFDIQVWLDGDLIVDSAAAGYSDYYYGPEYFDEMIEYDELSQFGGVGAIWVAGYGFVHQPLSRGEHTLVWYLVAEDYGVTNELTLNITVDK